MDWGQLLLALIFVVFVLYREHQYQERSEARDSEYISANERRDQEWRTFLLTTQKAQDMMMQTVAESLSGVKTQLMKNTVTLLMHDATAKGQDATALGTEQEIFERLQKT